MAVQGFRSFTCWECNKVYQAPYVQGFDNETGVSVLISQQACVHDDGVKIVTESTIVR
jgi:hypothetical protein